MTKIKSEQIDSISTEIETINLTLEELKGTTEAKKDELSNASSQEEVNNIQESIKVLEERHHNLGIFLYELKIKKLELEHSTQSNRSNAVITYISIGISTILTIILIVQTNQQTNLNKKLIVLTAIESLNSHFDSLNQLEKLAEICEPLVREKSLKNSIKIISESKNRVKDQKIEVEEVIDSAVGDLDAEIKETRKLLKELKTEIKSERNSNK